MASDKLAVTVDPGSSLAAQLEALDRDGYVVLKNLIDRERCALIREEAARLVRLAELQREQVVVLGGLADEHRQAVRRDEPAGDAAPPPDALLRIRRRRLASRHAARLSPVRCRPVGAGGTRRADSSRRSVGRRSSPPLLLRARCGRASARPQSASSQSVALGTSDDPATLEKADLGGSRHNARSPAL